MLPFNLPYLLWWEWLERAAGFAIVGIVSYALSMTGDARGRGWAKSGIIVLVFGIIFRKYVLYARGHPFRLSYHGPLLLRPSFGRLLFHQGFLHKRLPVAVKLQNLGLRTGSRFRLLRCTRRLAFNHRAIAPWLTKIGRHRQPSLLLQIFERSSFGLEIGVKSF